MVDHYRRLIADIPLEGMSRAHGRWAHDLVESLGKVPMAEPTVAMANLRDLLQRMLKSHADGRSRLRVLDQVTPRVQTLMAGLLRRIASESHPLPVAKANQCVLLLQLCHVLAQNACLAVWELAGPRGKLPLLGRGQVVTAVNEALELTHDVFALSFQRYHVSPPGSWRRLHALYAYAEQVGIARKQRRVLDDAFPCSAQERYARVLLLALANPWGMQRAELLDADLVCAALASSARFGRGELSLAVAGSGEDSGPGHGRADHGEPASTLELDLAPVLELLSRHLGVAPSEADKIAFGDGRGQHVQVRRSLVERMDRAWRGRVQRSFERQPGSRSVTVLPGLRAIHQTLAGGLDFAAFREQLSDGQIAASIGDSPAAWLSGHPAAAPQHVCAQVLDVSQGGYCLSWRNDAGIRMKMGELVGLLDDASGQDDADVTGGVRLGVLRWLRSVEHGYLVAGVEVLSRDLVPAMVRVFERSGRQRPLQRGLLTGIAADQPELVLPRLRDSRIASLGVVWPMGADDHGKAYTQRRQYQVMQEQELSPAYLRVALSDTIDTGAGL